MAHGVTGSAHAGKVLRDGDIRMERVTRKGIRVYVSWQMCYIGRYSFLEELWVSHDCLVVGCLDCTEVHTGNL